MLVRKGERENKKREFPVASVTYKMNYGGNKDFFIVEDPHRSGHCRVNGLSLQEPN